MKKKNHLGNMGYRRHQFYFNKVFSQDKGQEDVYEEVKDFVHSFLDGNDVCIFSYGQTGSGKTYTMGTELLTSNETT
jgi:DNA replication protein DnaC